MSNALVHTRRRGLVAVARQPVRLDRLSHVATAAICWGEWGESSHVATAGAAVRRGEENLCSRQQAVAFAGDGSHGGPQQAICR